VSNGRSTNVQKDLRWRLTLLLIAAITLLGVWRAGAAAQVKVFPGSAARGGQIIINKGCISCHAFAGGGGKLAPDLSRTPPDASSPGQLATAIWNHAPRMWVTAERKWNIELTSTDVADLFAYMYSALYFAPAGNAARGKAYFAGNCAACHSETPGGGGPGKPLSEWADVTDPLAWAGRMWNHSSEMADAAIARGRPWPTLSDRDVADLMIYLRSLPTLRTKSSGFSLGEPQLGRLAFERTCESCHSFGPSKVGKKVDLLERPKQRTVTGYVAAMWNHAPRMRARGNGQLPKLDPADMPNLLAFLFSQSYFFESGDVRRGQRVYERENCVRCHDERRRETGAPDLTQPAESYSPITLTASVWRHTPSMFEATRRSGLPWPHFEGSDMADVIAFLNSRVITKVAKPE
jgi:mono/diheme cytochrome c family protein